MTTRARKMMAEGIDVISFAAGEPDFNSPEAANEAAKKAIDAGLTKYAPSRGLPALSEAVIEKCARENGLTVSSDQIVVSCGAKHSLYNTMMVLAGPGDEVVVFAPYWMTYVDQIRLTGATPVVVHTGIETGYVPTPEQIEAAITPRTKAMVINSPSNPTGGAWPVETLKRAGELAVKHGFWIISDEIYERLTYGYEHVSIASLDKSIAEQTVTILGCSKTYAMTGWRIGFAVAPKPVASAMSNLQDQVTSNATTFAQAGAVAALRLPPSEVESMRAEFEARKNLGVGLLRAIPGVQLADPKGAFYFFADFSHYIGGKIPDDLALAEHLLATAHVATVPGSVFEGPGHLRLSYATSRKDIETGIARIAEALAQI
ncbi:MAG: pyridoxal phosphate-dependent aminotransferase [Armatimonadetes bacterium]|nr:pyridoxal phosphate-dependent aminotransferase [Armatimonadota bacterium]